MENDANYGYGYEEHSDNSFFEQPVHKPLSQDEIEEIMAELRF